MSKDKIQHHEYEYKGFKVNATKEPSIIGDVFIYYQIYDKDGVEVVGSYTSDETPFKKFADELRKIVDDIIDTMIYTGLADDNSKVMVEIRYED